MITKQKNSLFQGKYYAKALVSFEVQKLRLEWDLNPRHLDWYSSFGTIPHLSKVVQGGDYEMIFLAITKSFLKIIHVEALQFKVTGDLLLERSRHFPNLHPDIIPFLVCSKYTRFFL